MSRPVQSAWKLPLALAGGLVAGGVAGWLADGYATTGVALVAVAEIVLLLTHLRHISKLMMSSRSPASQLDPDQPRHDRFMMRSRRLAANLHDLRRAAGSLPDAIVACAVRKIAAWC
jgi:two-component system phosphate regulon sensor histidine kinase PhoR